jgi:hypothetical protein
MLCMLENACLTDGWVRNNGCLVNYFTDLYQLLYRVRYSTTVMSDESERSEMKQ